MIKSTDFTVTLAKPLVKALDKTFGTKLFKSHAEIGTGSATVKYERAPAAHRASDVERGERRRHLGGRALAPGARPASAA